MVFSNTSLLSDRSSQGLDRNNSFAMSVCESGRGCPDHFPVSSAPCHPLARLPRPFGTLRRHGRNWRRRHAEATDRTDRGNATSLKAPLQHDADKFRRMLPEVAFHPLRRLIGPSGADPHPERPRHHRRRHQVLVAATREHILVIAVVTFAVVDLDIPVRAHDFRELLRSARIRVERGDVVDDLLRRLADELANRDAVPVPRLGLARLPRLAARANYRASTGKPDLDSILDPEDPRLADLQPSAVQLFFLKVSTLGLMRQSVSHCSASLGWLDFT